MSGDVGMPDPFGGSAGGASDDLPRFARDPLGVVRRRWRGMTAALLLGLLVTAGVALTWKPAFWAGATVLVTSQRISDQFVESTVDSEEFERINAILGELLSRRNLSELVEKYELYVGQETMADRVQLALTAIDVEQDDGMGRPAPVGGSRIYSIGFSGRDPFVAAEVANDLAAQFASTHLEMRGEQARIATSFLRRELERTEQELDQQEQQITLFKQRHRGELPSELDSNLSKLDRLQEQRRALELQIAESERLVTVTSSGGGILPLGPRARLAALEARLQEQLAFQTEEHPQVTSLRKQIASAKAELASEGPASKPGGGSTRNLRAALARIDASTRDLDFRVARTPQRQEELVALERRAEVLRETYRETLRKVEAAELSEAVEEAQQGERATILDQAIPPDSPENPLLRLLAIGWLASMGLAVGVGILRELTDAVVVDSEELNVDFDLPIVGSVSRIS